MQMSQQEHVYSTSFKLGLLLNINPVLLNTWPSRHCFVASVLLFVERVKMTWGGKIWLIIFMELSMRSLVFEATHNCFLYGKNVDNLHNINCYVILQCD